MGGILEVLELEDQIERKPAENGKKLKETNWKLESRILTPQRKIEDGLILHDDVSKINANQLKSLSASVEKLTSIPKKISDLFVESNE
jgi:hypothetical protein